jgi:hypothetical protein
VVVVVVLVGGRHGRLDLGARFGVRLRAVGEMFGLAWGRR